jgi:hypothetical protein
VHNYWVLTELTVRMIHVIQAHPVLRIALGLLLAAGGLVAVVVGAGHGGLIVIGVLLVAGGVTAAISGRTSRPKDD